MLSNVACPTAQAVPPGAAATPKRAAPEMWTRLHALPFQWSTSCPWSCQPTAHAESFPAMATPERIFVRPAGLGLLTCRQALPFQCKINVEKTPAATATWPTAQASVGETAATP